MTRKERVKCILEGGVPDYVPYHFDLTLSATDMLGEHYGYDRDGVEDFIGNHLLQLDYTGPGGKANGYRSDVEASTEHVIDDFGVEWDNASNYNIGDWGMVGHPIQEMDFSGYTFPDGKGEGRFEYAKTLMEKYPDRFNVVRINGPFDFGWHLTGLEDFMVMMLLEEETTKMVLEKTTDYIVNIIEAIPAGVDAVRIIEDWGVQKGLLFSKELWMKYIYPCYMRIHAAIRNKGLHIMHHSCGDVSELMPEIIELGTEVIDAMQPESMDLAAIKRDYGDKIILFGGLGSQSTIPYGTKEEVLEEAHRTLKLIGSDGRCILGPAGSISTDTPLENVIALVDFFMELSGSAK